MVAIFPNVFLWRRSYSQNWEVLTLKNIASSHLHMPVRPTLLHRMALVSFLLFRKNLGNLREFFGQMVYRPPWQKIARTPMHQRNKNFCLCWHTETRLFRESTILLLKSTEIDNEKSSVESFSLENVDLIDISPVFPCTLAKFLQSHNAESDRTFSRKSCSLFMLLVPSRI